MTDMSIEGASKIERIEFRDGAVHVVTADGKVHSAEIDPMITQDAMDEYFKVLEASIQQATFGGKAIDPCRLTPAPRQSIQKPSAELVSLGRHFTAASRSMHSLANELNTIGHLTAACSAVERRNRMNQIVLDAVDAAVDNLLPRRSA